MVEKEVIEIHISNLGYLMGRSVACDGCEHQAGREVYPNNSCELTYQGSWPEVELDENYNFCCHRFKRGTHVRMRPYPEAKVYTPGK